MAELAYGYAVIEKFDKNDDGTLNVYGKATDDSIDSDEQICDPAWLDRAMPEWMKWGNIREQHSSIAAGVATEYEKKADGHYIGVKVVDPGSIKKVEAGVLKGFSIGIRAPRVVRDEKAINGRIIDGQIVEVSLVDRPANPNAKLTVAKTIGGELIQVEELAAFPTPATLKPKAETMEKTLLDVVKGFHAELVKFDQAAYDSAVGAIADLIVVEAGEIKEGHDERDSIQHLLDALKHLYRWYEDEVEEGEVPGVEPESAAEDIVEAVEEALDLAAAPDAVKEDAPAEDAPAEEEAKMCKECGKSEDECKCDDSMTEEKSMKVSDEAAADLVAKAVKAATEAVQAELDAIKSAKAEAEAKVEQLDKQLADALTKTAAGGPKRSKITENADDLLVKAAVYAQKAKNTTDPVLAKGYKEMSDDLFDKANKLQKGA